MNTSKNSILLVDDDDSHRMLARRAILSCCPGAEIIEAEGLADASTAAERPLAFIILDLRLQGGSGRTLLAKIRERHSPESLPVMILSTSALESDVQSCYAAGANAYIIKSCDPAEFGDNLKGALRFFIGTL